MVSKLIATGLFAIALGLFTVALSIYDNTQRHARYAWSSPIRFDTLTGGVERCNAVGSMLHCEPWDLEAEVSALDKARTLDKANK